MSHTPSRNLVFIGEIGTGKTLLIETLTKYFSYESFDAITANVSKETFIPIQKNTTLPKLYTVTIGDTVYNLLDTPGFTEAYGKPKNFEIFKEIESAFLQLPEIHGICFVLKASKTEMPNFIEKVITNTLTLFPKKAVQNVFFIFTHVNETHFTSGTGAAKIKQIIANFQKTYEAKIRYSVENICLIDNLGMRWLIAIKNGLSRPPLKETELQASWNESKKQLHKIIKSASELPGITKNEIVQCRLLKEIGIMLQGESIQSAEAKKLQHVLNDGIFKLTIISKLDNIIEKNAAATVPISLTKLIEGLLLIKRAVKSEELKQKINELSKYNNASAVLVENVVSPTKNPTPTISERSNSIDDDDDRIPPEPVLPIIIPQKLLPREVPIFPQQPLPHPETIIHPQPPPRFIAPPPPPIAPETPQADYPQGEEFNDEDGEYEIVQKPQVPQSRQLELLEDIAEGIKDNCEQGDLTNIYASELASIHRAVSAPTPDDIDLKDLSQALKVFEHNPKIGHRTKNNIREYLNGL
uniref:G domain-containing protein n=1 Tax=Panagrolaimus sp. PS1159 TaxID=55785 RepID=A0AC35GHL4_9BILA